MKTIYFLRHAKSSWKDDSLSDRERPLNPRGLRDAPRMATYLAGQVAAPDIYVSSPSRRTQDTAQYFLEAFGSPADLLLLSEDLYHGRKSDFLSVIARLLPGFRTALLLGHNPGMTDFVNHLTGARIDNIPTCGVAGVQWVTNDWAEINKCPATLQFFYYPKGLDLH